MAKSIREKAKEVFRAFMKKKRCLLVHPSGLWGYCVTCGKLVTGSNCQAGHAIPSGKNSIYFEENLVHIQCYQCNIGLSGNYSKYEYFIRQKYGDEYFDRMLAKKWDERKISHAEYEDMIQLYKKKLKDLDNIGKKVIDF